MPPRLKLKGMKFGRLKVLDFAFVKNGYAYWKCLCECGTIKDISGTLMKSGHTKSCGCLQKEIASKDISNQRFGKLIALYRCGKYKDGSYIWHCECDCGGEKDVVISELARGHTKSCGCLTALKDLTGQRFGKLVAVCTQGKDKFGSYYWLCDCDCGNDITVRSGSLVKGDTKSCGCLQQRINGIPASSQQLGIAEILGVNDSIHVNYKFGRKYIDIAFPYRKIAIEYDSWYWHGHKQQEDSERTLELIDNGWKVLSIKGGMKIPDKNTLLFSLDKLSLDNPYQEIVMADWEIGVTHEQIIKAL